MQELPSTPDMPEPYDAPEPQEAPEAHFSSRPEAGLAETGVDLPEPESSLPEPEANLPEPGATPDFLTPSSGSQLPNRARTGAAAGAKPKTGKRRRRAKGQRTRSQRPRSRRFHFLRDIINSWWERLFSTVFGGNWDTQAQLYDSGRRGSDYLLNTLGSVCWGALFPILTIVSTQVIGPEEAGKFNMAFTTATLLLYLGNYGVKTFQVSDIDEMHSFASYRIQRLLTCLLMLLCGFGFCALHGYSQEMVLISAGAYGFRAVDALADVYEGRLQQADKLYLAGISQAVRSAFAVLCFTVLLVLTRSLVHASIALAIAGILTLFLLTIPLTRLETDTPRPARMIEIHELFTECFPAFLALFLFALIEAIPKYAMEGVLPYESQVVFSAIYFPAQAILMVVGFVYRPQLVRLANIWADTNKRARFDLIVVAMLVVSVLITLAGLAFAKWLAVPLNSLLYATDFEAYRTAQYLMIIAGGMTGIIDFLYQVITVLRQQALATRIYLVVTALITVASIVLVRLVGFMGAVWSYFGAMAILLGALLVLYLLVRTGKKQVE